jgi:hypothetical protein
MPNEYAESAGDVLAPFSDRFSGTAHTWAFGGPGQKFEDK